MVPSSAVQEQSGRVVVSFESTPGKIYTLWKSPDLETWARMPDPIYAIGQEVVCPVFDPPALVDTLPSTDPLVGPEDSLCFYLTAFDDGSAVASWRGRDGQPCQAYLASFDLRDGADVLAGGMSKVVTPSVGTPYRLSLYSLRGTKLAAFTSLQAPASEADDLARLSSQQPLVRAQLLYLAAHPTDRPPSVSFDDRGQPSRQFFRVFESDVDSNHDHIDDATQLAMGDGTDTYDMDLDSDGIPNGYDRDLWPAAQYPATHALLGNVLINEALLSNDFTNKDEDGDSSDWVELYNPTNSAINLGGWFLSDSTGTTARMKWTIPAGTVIGSGQFLVIWGSSKNRGTASTPLHTGFGYANGTPEPVVLSRPAAGGTATIVDRYAVGTTANYGAQRPDVSFGRYPTPEGLKTGYMPVPTPGENGSRGPGGMHNVTGFKGFTAPPVFGGSAPGVRGSGSITATLSPPAGGGTIHFTTNAADPSPRSELYTAPLVAERTAVIRAIAVKDGYLPSASITRSFIHKDDILGTSPQGTVPADHQGARDLAGVFTGRLRGYPEATSEGASFPLLYGMNPQVIAARRDAIAASLEGAPVVSVVCPVPGLFEVASGGLYANSGETAGTTADPLERDWERACSLEIIEPGTTLFTQANAALEITGASSIFNNTTRKHNLRIRFDESYGPAELVYQLFDGVPTPGYASFHLKNTSQDSWAIAGGNDPAARDAATYCREGWVAATHRAMGHEAPYSRWSHLFLNGIYWGAYQIIERADDGFMDAHFGDDPYDVIRQPGVVVSGDDVAWQALNAAAAAVRDAPAASRSAAYTALEAQLDLRNFVDYLICNSYAFNSDWPWNNWRAGRRRFAGERWRFIVWDAEASLQQGQETLSAADYLLSSTNDGPEFLHSCLKNYQPYRDLFSARLHWHFEDHSAENPVNHPQGHPSTSGTLMLTGPRNVLARFQAEMTKFEPLVHAESARWGDMAKTVPYAKSDPSYLPTLARGDWDRATNHVLNVWLPTRQSHYLADMQAAGLYQP